MRRKGEGKRKEEREERVEKREKKGITIMSTKLSC